MSPTDFMPGDIVLIDHTRVGRVETVGAIRVAVRVARTEVHAYPPEELEVIG